MLPRPSGDWLVDLVSRSLRTLSCHPCYLRVGGVEAKLLAQRSVGSGTYVRRETSPMQRAQGSLCPAGVGGRPRTPLVGTSGSTHPPPKNKTQIINNSMFYSVQNFSTYENKVYKWQITLEPQRPGDLQDLSGRESGAWSSPLASQESHQPPAQGHAPSALHRVTHPTGSCNSASGHQRPAPPWPGCLGLGSGQGVSGPLHRDSQVKRQKPPKLSPSPHLLPMQCGPGGIVRTGVSGLPLACEAPAWTQPEGN